MLFMIRVDDINPAVPILRNIPPFPYYRVLFGTAGFISSTVGLNRAIKHMIFFLALRAVQKNHKTQPEALGPQP